MPAGAERGRALHTAAIQVGAVETHDLRPGRDAGDAVVERDALLLAEVRQLGRRRRGQGKRAANEGRRGAVRVPCPPQQGAARLPQAVEAADEREVAQRLLFETDAARELVER